jgi:hypothetical protein
MSVYAIALPAIAGLCRWRNVEKKDKLFIVLIWMGLLNEIASQILIHTIRNNAINTNIYYLIEGILTVELFKQWNLFGNSRKISKSIIIVFLLVWIIENLVLSTITQFNSYFNILCSFVVVMMSINMINRIIIEEKKLLLRNAIFLICIGFIVFFTYAILIEIFLLYGLDASVSFRKAIFRINDYVNLFSNLVYTMAIIWMPKKNTYTLL